MTSPDRLDPPAFCGCFAHVDSDIPPGMTLADSRSRRTGSTRFDSSTTSGATRAGAVLAPHDRTPRARPQPEEEVMSLPHTSELLAGQLARKRERAAALRRLGRDGRLAAYRRGEFDLDACCLWASMYPREVPLLNGEFEFIARFTPEVCE